MKRTKNTQTISIWLLLVFLVMSCQEVTTSDLIVQETDPEIQVYFDKFEEEAAKRNVKVDLQDLRVYGIFEDLESSKGGTCTYGENTPREVSINKNYWIYANPVQKAYLVYHELGHCALGLSHDDRKDEKGVCLSIMASGTTTCRLAHTREAMEAYLDELFSKKK